MNENLNFWEILRIIWKNDYKFLFNETTFFKTNTHNVTLLRKKIVNFQQFFFLSKQL